MKKDKRRAVKLRKYYAQRDILVERGRDDDHEDARHTVNLTVEAGTYHLDAGDAVRLATALIDAALDLLQEQADEGSTA